MAERKNHHLLDMVRTLLLESSVPPKFWVEALSTAMYLINRLPSQQLNFDSPYYRLFSMHPDYHNLHTFGCVCFVHLPSHERHKLTAQSARCAFMGYSIGQKGFLCYDVVTNRLRMSRNVNFFNMSTILSNMYLVPMVFYFLPLMISHHQFRSIKPVLFIREDSPRHHKSFLTLIQLLLQLLFNDLPAFVVLLIGIVSLLF